MAALLQDVLSWAHDSPVLGLLAGFVMLIGGADLLVRGSIWIALQLGISRMTVGLTLVAAGTSMPELMVSFTAADSGRPAIAMANCIGSNTFNILLIVGVAAAIRRIHIVVGSLELWYLLFATLLAGVPFVWGHEVSRPLALVMLLMLVAFCWQLILRERSNPQRRQQVVPTGMPDATPDVTSDAPIARGGPVAWIRNVAYVAAGFFALKFGADWLVDGAVAIARSLGMTEALIGMTIVATGTSLPELFTSVIAARKGQPEISIGNVVGSNIFNIGAVLGVSGILAPFSVDVHDLGPLMLVTLGSALALIFCLRRLAGVSRGIGVAFALVYIAFLLEEAFRTGAI
jgi:cation:H+ antiporter